MYEFISFSQQKTELINSNMMHNDILVTRSSKSQLDNAAIDSIYEYNWDSNINDWTHCMKTTNKYDQNLNLLQKIRYSWNISRLEWIHFDRYEYKYNELDKDTLYELFEWDSKDNIWKPFLKRSQKYDKDGNCILDCIYHYDSTSDNGWYGSAYTTYKYENNSLVEYINYSWDYDIGNWYLLNKHTYQYDEIGNKLKENIFVRNLTENLWNEANRKIFIYDSLNNLIEYFEQENDFSMWNNKHRELYSYDIYNRRYRVVNYKGCIPYDLYLLTRDTTQIDTNSTVLIICSLDNYCEYCSDSVWYLNEKDSIVYDSAGNMIEQYNFEWKELEKLWINRYRYLAVFDTLGNQTEFTSYTWDTLKTSWIFNNKFTYNFDQHGNFIESRSFMWDTETNEWIDDIHNIYIYNANNQWIEFETYWYSWIYRDYFNIKRIEQKYTTSGNVKERIEYKKTAITDDNWEKKVRIVYFWSDEPNNINEITEKNKNFIIYPNPCDDKVILYSIFSERIDKVNIYSSIGHLHYSKAINASESILNLEELKSGIYLIQIQTSNDIWVSKFIKN